MSLVLTIPLEQLRKDIKVSNSGSTKSEKKRLEIQEENKVANLAKTNSQSIDDKIGE